MLFQQLSWHTNFSNEDSCQLYHVNDIGTAFVFVLSYSIFVYMNVILLQFVCLI